jgi:hypothetical protein
VYEHMYKWAQQEPLNQKTQPPGYEKYLKRLLDGEVVRLLGLLEDDLQHISSLESTHVAVLKQLDVGLLPHLFDDRRGHLCRNGMNGETPR